MKNLLSVFTKKKILLTLLVLIALSAILAVKMLFVGQRTKKGQSNLHFINLVKDIDKAKFSLDKVNADFATNQMVLNTVVGTLVKYGPSGKIEPYLADTWTESEDKKTWIFHIRPNLYAQNDKKITASLFVTILKNSLIEYSKHGSVLVFDHSFRMERFFERSRFNWINIRRR